ncbi:hypothetical protein L1S32_08580 [Methanogenium sp. S4BF]|uniref:hypothetical protein n=1 Tax=Methanogenium sp. S4BF TaxID=1789226 RepID=UPI002415F2F7|nr:hypothetical protein [Methanogenium sp. S4BF]WFN33897.1 hypothetical protein L1S32_08580 [Methanogenium sp. S4BF]
MSSFVVEVDDFNGRQGVLDIGGGHVMTPAYVASDIGCHAMGDAPVDPRCRTSVGEYDLWVHRSDIERMRRHPEKKEAMEDAVCERMRRIESPAKLLHYTFFTDVAGLPKESFVDLLRLQYRAGANVIEIPRPFCDTHAYERAVQAALEWQQNTWSETPLMGIARTASDLAMLERYLPQLGGIGIDCRRLDKPLLYQVRKRLKKRDIWVHAFSAPLQYHEVKNQGTLGMLINWFGVDTVNTIALSDHVRQYFADLLSRMEGEERANLVKTIRYFAPCDYSTYTFEKMEEYYGEGRPLSDFCDCPVCRNLTVGGPVDNLPEFYRMNHMHRAFAYYTEAEKYQRALINNETGLFIAGKPYAAEIIRRAVGFHSPEVILQKSPGGGISGGGSPLSGRPAPAESEIPQKKGMTNIPVP